MKSFDVNIICLLTTRIHGMKMPWPFFAKNALYIELHLKLFRGVDKNRKLQT